MKTCRAMLPYRAGESVHVNRDVMPERMMKASELWRGDVGCWYCHGLAIDCQPDVALHRSRLPTRRCRRSQLRMWGSYRRYVTVVSHCRVINTAAGAGYSAPVRCFAHNKCQVVCYAPSYAQRTAPHTHYNAHGSPPPSENTFFWHVVRV